MSLQARTISYPKEPTLKLQILLLLLVLIVATACEPRGRMATYTESELRAELSECASILNPSVNKKVSCGNISRQCQKRVKADGKYRKCE